LPLLNLARFRLTQAVRGRTAELAEPVKPLEPCVTNNTCNVVPWPLSAVFATAVSGLS